jgi:dCTP deaminase
MSIKSDKWIRRMARQHGMIEPFEPGQVKQNAGGGRIVSYGTSSYGYDVRCANEFKIFTNINSTIVDPKAFDPSSFVDVVSDVCIIPPNSFAWRVPWSTSAFRAAPSWCAWERAPTRAAASSST